MEADVNELLIQYADKYETADFLSADPSRFMHQVEGPANQETVAFIASCLSYGNRKQFFPKIQKILDDARGDVYNWVKNGDFDMDIPVSPECYYRLFTNQMMNHFLHALKDMVNEYGTLGNYIQSKANDGFSAIVAITSYFNSKGIDSVIPKDTSSACKRICMFLRWMVRDNSDVDLGLWSDFIDKQSLIMPLDTHVLQEACRLGLLNSKTANMNVAKRLTAKMRTVFPDDPLKGDFALFGYGVNH